MVANVTENPCWIIGVNQDQEFTFVYFFCARSLCFLPQSINNQFAVPSRELTYQLAQLKMIFLFPRWDMLIPGRVYVWISLYSAFFTGSGRELFCFWILSWWQTFAHLKRNQTCHIHRRKWTYPLTRDYFNAGEYIFQPLIFRGHVSFLKGVMYVILHIQMRCSVCLRFAAAQH